MNQLLPLCAGRPLLLWAPVPHGEWGTEYRAYSSDGT